LAAATLACGHRAAPRASSADLPPPGDVARVGGVVVGAPLVGRVARASGLPSRDALAAVVDDTLAAEGGRIRGVDRTPPVQWASTVALGRAVEARVLDRARAQGPPTDDELATVSVIHAVVMRSSVLTEARALAIAGTIAQSVASAKSADDFDARARAVPHPGARVVVERLPPFGADGRTADGAELDAGFVAAAFALHVPSETSPIVATPFGWHVLRLLERSVPEMHLLEARRRDLAEAVVRLRARERLDALLRDLRRRVPIEVASGAEALVAGLATASP